MAQQFNLTAQINLQSPKNVGRVVSDIQRQLKGSGLNTVNIKVKADPRSMAQTNRQLQNVSKNSRAAAKDINTLNRNLQEATRRFSVITLATGGLLSLVTGFKNATKAAIEFERELVKISQVTGKSVQQLQGLTKEVTRLSTAFGVSSADLLNVSRTLAQAGFNAEKTRKALDILAKTTLAATFDNIQDTTEGAIALLRQFGAEAKRTGGDVAFLERSLDAINAVSKRFAVESGDLITVIRRVGGVFSSAGGEINELIALFTSVRATTRESAETIATGLRTIFTRIQRTETIDQLRNLNIELRDSQGNFVGAFEAVKRLSAGLATIDPRSGTFSNIVEELGGFRQIGKVIPLIQQFATAQDALRVAQAASGSTAKDAATAQQGLGVQIQKVREEFTALIRKFTDSGPFNTIATGALKIASAMIKVAEAVEPLLPLLTTMFGLKLGRALAPGVANLAGIARGGGGGGRGFSRFARGGMVPGSGNRDTVPAMLTPGEFVIKKSSVKSLGAGTLAAMNNNRYAQGGTVANKFYSRNLQTRIVRRAKDMEGTLNTKNIQFNPNDNFIGNVVDKSYPSIIPQGFVNAGKRVQAKKFERLVAQKNGGLSGLAKSDIAPLDFVLGRKKIEIKRTLQKVSDDVVRDKTVRALMQGQIGGASSRKLSGKRDDVKLPRVELASDSRKVIPKELAKQIGLREKTRKRKASGGNISGSDTVPALLTPGEFVFNKSAARSIGYSNLNRMNKQGVQGFAKGGPVGFQNGGPVLPINTGTQAGGALAAMKASGIFEGLEKLNKSSEKNTKTTDKNTKTTEKNITTRAKVAKGLQDLTKGLGGVKNRLQSFGASLATGLGRLDGIASSAQSFVFLAATIGAVTSQMSSFSDTTKTAINRTVAFYGGVIGIGATLINTLSSVTSALFLNKVATDEVTKSKVKEKITTDLSSKGSGGAVGIAGLFSKLVGPLILITALVTAASAAISFYNNKLKAETEKLSRAAGGLVSKLKETGEGVELAFSAILKAAQSAQQETFFGGRQANALSRDQFENASLTGDRATRVAALRTQREAVRAEMRDAGQDAADFPQRTAARSARLSKELNKLNKQIQSIVIEEFNAGLREAIEGFSDLIKESKKLSAAYDDLNQRSDFLTPEQRSSELRNLADERSAAINDARSSANAQLPTAITNALSKSAIEASGNDFNTFMTSIQKTAEGDVVKGFDIRTSATLNLLFEQLGAAAKEGQAAIQQSRSDIQEFAKTIDGSKSKAEILSGEFGSLAETARQNIIDEAKVRADEKRAQAKIADEIGDTGAANALRKEARSIESEGIERSNKEREYIDLIIADAHTRHKAEMEAIAATQAIVAEQKRILGVISTLDEVISANERETKAVENLTNLRGGNNISLEAQRLTNTDLSSVTTSDRANLLASEMSGVIAAAPLAAQPGLQKSAELINQTVQAVQKLNKDAQSGGLIGARSAVAGGTGDVGKIISDVLPDVPEEIRKQIIEALDVEKVGSEIDPEELAQALRAFTDLTQKEIEALTKASDATQSEIDLRKAKLDQLDKAYTAELNARQNLLETQEKIADIGLRSAKLIAQSNGREIQIRKDFAGAEQRRQRKAQADLDAAGVVGIGAGDVAGLTDLRRQLLEDQRDIAQRAIDTPADPNLDEEQRKNLRQLSAVNTELARLADRSGRVDDLFSEMSNNIELIEKERQKRQQVIGVIEEFVVGGQNTRQALVDSANGIRAAFATGTLQNQTEQQRAATVGLLDKLSDVPLLNGFTGGQIKQELIFRDAIKLGLDPKIAQALATATTKEQQLIDSNELLAFEINKLTQEMQGAQAGLNLAGGLATGGLVQYRAGGGTIFKPKGTDTVPAMLTPGEFVIRKSAVDAIGADNLAAINDGASYFHYGGDVGKHKHPHLDPKVAKGRYGRGLAPRSASEVFTDFKDQMTPLSPAPPPLRDRDPHIIDMINTPDEFSPDLHGIPFTHTDYGKTGGLQLEDPNAIHKQNLKASAKTTANIAGEFISDYGDRVGPVIGTAGSEIVTGIPAGFRGTAALLHSGFTDPDTGPRQRNVTGADAPKLEEYSQTQQFIGKAAAELFEGGRSPTLGSGLMRGLDELSDFIAGDRQGTRAAERQRIDRQYMGVGQANEQRRFGGDVASPGGLGPSERELQKEREFEKERQELIAFNKKEKNARTRFQGYTKRAEEEGKLVLTKDEDGFPNYKFQKSMTDAELKLIVEGKDYNTGELRKNPQGGTDFWLAAQARDELYRRDSKKRDDEFAARNATFKAEMEADELERKQKEEARKARDKALGIDKLPLDSEDPDIAFRARMEAAKRRVRGVREVEAAAEQQKVSAEISSPSDLPKAKAAEQQAEKAVKDAVKAQTEAATEAAELKNLMVVPEGFDNPGYVNEFGHKYGSREHEEMTNIIWNSVMKEMEGDTESGWNKNKEDIKAEYQRRLEAGNLWTEAVTGKYMSPMGAHISLRRAQEGIMGPLRPTKDLAGEAAGAGLDADMQKKLEKVMLPEGVTVDSLQEELNKNQGQGGSSIGSFLSALGSSVFSNAKDFLSRMEGGDKFVGPLDTRSRRQKARDRRFGRRGIESRSQRGTPAQLARRQQEAGVELDPNNPINKAKYERILFTQGPVIAARFARTSGYEPPQGLPGRGITQSFRNRPNMMGTPQAMQQFQQFQQYQQFLRFQQQNNRGGIRPRGASRFATGGGVSGADTVPAMLTPGEFVMSAGAVRQHGVGAMRALNRGQIPGFNRGGMVGGVQYRQNGGFMSALGGAAQSLGFDTSAITETFDNFVGNFSSTFDNITKTFGGIASTISELANSFGNFTMTHQVVISGIPDVDSNALANQVADKLAGVVVEKVKGAFEQQGKDYNPPGGN